MKGCMSTDLGIITIDPEVIAKYAGTVAVECFGIVGMAAVNMKDGLVHLLKKESLTRGIHVNISDDNHISIDFHIIVAYGVSISAVTDNLISDVKYRVEEFSGMQVDKINVYIEGVRVIDEFVDFKEERKKWLRKRLMWTCLQRCFLQVLRTLKQRKTISTN